MGNPTQPNS